MCMKLELFLNDCCCFTKHIYDNIKQCLKHTKLVFVCYMIVVAVLFVSVCVFFLQNLLKIKLNNVKSTKNCFACYIITIIDRNVHGMRLMRYSIS